MFVLGTLKAAVLPLQGRARWRTGAGRREVSRKEKFNFPKSRETEL